MSTGKHGIEKNFCNSRESYDEAGFEAYAESISSNRVEEGGLNMPLLVRKSDFHAVGGYPEGNIVPGSDPFNPVIASAGVSVVSGDAAFIQKLEKIGIQHITAFNSIVYHFQEGERRSVTPFSFAHTSDQIAICNDQVMGINGEKVLWGHLLDLPNTIPFDYEKVEGKTPESFQAYANDKLTDASLILQNASFVPRFFPDKHTLVYLQDNLRAMGKMSVSQEMNLKNADCRVTNTIDIAVSYPEYDFEICPVGVDSKLFRPENKERVRKKYGINLEDKVGIFVGALDEVKGWSEVKSIIEDEDLKIQWLVISKYDEEFIHPRVRQYSKQSQDVLVELLNAADFFILGSPIETQCLAAIEAALCDVPVVIKPVGIFTSLTEVERARVGSVQMNLKNGVKDVLANMDRFFPRTTMLEKGLSLAETNGKWYSLLVNEKMRALSNIYRRGPREKIELSVIRKAFYRLEIYYRFRILKTIIGRDTFYSAAEISVYTKDNLPKPCYKTLRYLWRFFRGKS